MKPPVGVGASAESEIEYLAGTTRSRTAGGNSRGALATLTQAIDLPWVRGRASVRLRPGCSPAKPACERVQRPTCWPVFACVNTLRRDAELRNARLTSP